MTSILIPVAIVSAIGLLAGLLLAVASKLMAVPVDKKAEEIIEALPGANCGACGFSGCAGYAAALSRGKTKDTSLCAPGGNAVSKEIAQITGLAAGSVIPHAAVVLCRGSIDNAQTKLEYSGINSCKMAVQLFGGPKSCQYGCLGFGDCAVACPYDAIYVCNGVARINPLLCHACKACVDSCPKKLIKLLPLNVPQGAVLCVNKEKGALARKQCTASCIGCKLCVKACESGAITVENFCASIDETKCIGCGKCAAACKQGCISMTTTSAVK